MQSPFHIVPDELTGKYRISSKAFGPSKADGGLSGDLAQLLTADGLPETAMNPAVRDAVGAAALTIDAFVAQGAQVSHDPTWYNWYHGSVFGIKKSAKTKFVKASHEIIAIDQTAADRLWQRHKADTARSDTV